ncbi:sodium:solute symporter [Thermoleophilia bacterium SCSIO 60948]|nr:sodium:solute symporter [Thermoleophilia bacterium SCSIO 60948]
MLSLGVLMFAIAFAVRAMVKNTHSFVIAGRQIPLGFGVGSVIAVWTWSMAVMLSSAQAYSWGISGLLWFIVPNGLAVMIMVPFALRLRRQMPAGYTIIEFIRERFRNRTASNLMLGAILFGLLAEICINLFGVTLVMGVIFGLDATAVLAITLVIVTLYSYFGGLWTSAITATINTLLITVPAALVVLYVFYKVGGAGAVFDGASAAGSQNFNPVRWETASAFGISLALGLFASTMADQTFWQKVWAMKPENLDRTFLWSGLWFYPIPMTLGLLGLVGLAAGVVPGDLGAFGPGGVGPYVVSHVGLPVILIAAYVLIICNACYSSIDGAFSALSSIVAVDVVNRVFPNVSERRLFAFTKSSIFVAGAIGGAIVLSGIDYVNLVTTIFFIKAALVVPLGLAIFWKRMTAPAFIVAVVGAVAIGYPIRQEVNELAGIVALMGTSLIASIGISLLGRKSFDFGQLKPAKAGLASAPPAQQPTPAQPMPTRAVELPAGGQN